MAAASAAVNALPRKAGAIIDVSTHEALATLAITELTRAANGKGVGSNVHNGKQC